MRRAAGVALGFLALAVLVGSGVWENLRDWVHGQKVYQWTLEEIRFDPEPPPWIKSGATGLIAEARREGLGRFEGGSVLDLDKDALERAFKKLVWVEKVIRVQVEYPNQVRIQLRYRKPVARVLLPRPRTARGVTYYVDEHAVILPNRDLEVSAVPDLLDLHDLVEPYDGNPGRIWQRPTPSGDAGEPDALTIAAASLAGFLLDQHEREGWPLTVSGQPFRLDLIAHPPVPTPEPKLYVRAENGTWIFWNDPPGAETPDQPTAEEKWNLLRDWVERNDPQPLHEEDRLFFSRQGVRWKRFQAEGSSD